MLRWFGKARRGAGKGRRKGAEGPWFQVWRCQSGSASTDSSMVGKLAGDLVWCAIGQGWGQVHNGGQDLVLHRMQCTLSVTRSCLHIGSAVFFETPGRLHTESGALSMLGCS